MRKPLATIGGDLVIAHTWLQLAVLLVMPAGLIAQERLPSSYVQVSAMMRDMRDSLMAGVIEGSLYNEHPSKPIRVSEVAITSSAGKRVFRFACVLGPYESKDFSLHTGFRLDFRDPKNNWWNFVVTRAAWAEGASGQKRCPE